MKKNPRGLVLPRVSKYNAFWIKRFEKSKIEKYSDLPPRAQPVFIIGAPRTGSTILYQIITNVLDMLYIDNLTDLFYRNLYFGFWLSDRRFHQRAHDCYTSKLGNTFHCGLRGPSECAGFWYRWLPKDRHYIARGEVSETVREEIRRSVFAIINRWSKPLIFKNLNAGQRLGLLSEIFPDAKFIFVKRDPLFTAQSIYLSLARNKKDKWWSIIPKEEEALTGLNIHEQIIKYIFILEKRIFQDRLLFKEENFLTINYSNINNDLQNVIREIHDFLNPVSERDHFLPPDLVPGDKIRLDAGQVESYNKEIQKFDWDNYAVK